MAEQNQLKLTILSFLIICLGIIALFVFASDCAKTGYLAAPGTRPECDCFGIKYTANQSTRVPDEAATVKCAGIVTDRYNI